MTFGNGGIRGIGGSWGSDEDAARAIFNRYLEIGGNFIDTADSYAAGASEELIGKFVAEAGVRDRVVISLKFSNNVEPGNPNAGGNGRKNLDARRRRLIAAAENGLHRPLSAAHLGSDPRRPKRSCGHSTISCAPGKIRYAGLSDVPGWYAARAQTWAEAHALTPPICLQLPYSLAERSIENEFVPLAQTLASASPPGVHSPWACSPANTGPASRPQGGFRSDASGSGLGLFTERNRRIVAALEAVAGEVGRSMAQIALNWVVTQPGVGAAIIGASRIEQLDDNLAALDFSIPVELRRQLQAASAVDPSTLIRCLPTITRPAFSMHGGRSRRQAARLLQRDLSAQGHRLRLWPVEIQELSRNGAPFRPPLSRKERGMTVMPANLTSTGTAASFVLTLACDDQPGIVAAVATELAAIGGNIVESNQFRDVETNCFFMRIAFTGPLGMSRDGVERALKPAIDRVRHEGHGCRRDTAAEDHRDGLEVRSCDAASALPDPRRLAECRGGRHRLQS